ncbi:MAG TPA: hypothetical protein VFN55_03915 [Solirubrobacteraceae bacterium]|nr:hypothetical protein [Solirubrobacteraceae bacterium]
MRHDPDALTLAEVVARACELVDPDGVDAVVGELQQAFEDADEPIRAVEDIESRVGAVLANLDPAVANPSLAVAGAVTIYLSYRRDEYGVEPAKLLRMAAEAEWQGDPPDLVGAWLADRGISV